MAEITAALVKDLRDKTGAGMMDCKKALTETKGDFENAVDWLRKKGLAAAAKKAGRVTADGLVGIWPPPLLAPKWAYYLFAVLIAAIVIAAAVLALARIVDEELHHLAERPALQLGARRDVPGASHCQSPAFAERSG